MATDSLPPIPEKRYFSIGEVGELCRLKPHVLRYWEQEFSQLKPLKRRGNRRYYRQQDVRIVRRIRALLYDQGYTIQGARLQLETVNRESEAEGAATHSSLASVRRELEDIVRMLDD